MKEVRHKRKESFSLLLVSNLDGQTRQLGISFLTLRLLGVLFLVICILCGCAVYQVFNVRQQQAGLQGQIAAQEEELQRLEAENTALNSEKLALTEENELLRQESTVEKPEEAGEESETEPETGSDLPGKYPYDGAGVISSAYSEENPYLSIRTYIGGNVVAAGDGTIVTVSSDDTYEHIIEIEHASGHKTRYLCKEEAEPKVEEGIQIQAGEPLLEIMTDDTQLDYQVLYEDAPVDPLSIIDAKG